MFDTDVFIAGGGPAGLAAAIALRARGLRVVVADGNKPPIDKACGEGLMPDALAAARAIGIEIPREAGYAFRGIRFMGGETQVNADFPDGEGLGLRRTVLHEMLLRQVEEAGVDLRWEAPITGIDDGAAYAGGHRVAARWIVGADGSQSSVRRWARLEGSVRNSQRIAFRRHYAAAPWTPFVEIHWGEGCQFYVTPVAASEVCVVLISRDPHLRIDDVLPQFPALAEHLGGARGTTPERGSATATRKLRSVVRGNVALIGDASGTVDAITGEGLCLAFRQAEALAGALAAGEIGLYRSRHRRLGLRPAFMADFMLTMDRAGWLRTRALHALAEQPRLFANLLAMHVGKLPFTEFAWTGLSLGRRILTA